MNNKLKWIDNSNQAGTYIRHTITNNSVTLSVVVCEDGFYTYSNIFPKTIVLDAQTLDGAKTQAIDIARKRAETVLNEICEMI